MEELFEHGAKPVIELEPTPDEQALADLLWLDGTGGDPEAYLQMQAVRAGGRRSFFDAEEARRRLFAYLRQRGGFRVEEEAYGFTDGRNRLWYSIELSRMPPLDPDRPWEQAIPKAAWHDVEFAEPVLTADPAGSLRWEIPEFTYAQYESEGDAMPKRKEPPEDVKRLFGSVFSFPISKGLLAAEQAARAKEARGRQEKRAVLLGLAEEARQAKAHGKRLAFTKEAYEARRDLSACFPWFYEGTDIVEITYEAESAWEKPRLVFIVFPKGFGEVKDLFAYDLPT